jgi:hypothetical protein
MNRAAVDLLTKNIERYVPFLADITGDKLSRMRFGPALLQENGQVTLDWMSFNTNAIDFLEQNPKEINWDNLSQNKNAGRLLCKLDKEKMKANAFPLKEELMMYVYDPDRMARISAKAGIDMRDYVKHF